MHPLEYADYMECRCIHTDTYLSSDSFSAFLECLHLNSCTEKLCSLHPYHSSKGLVQAHCVHCIWCQSTSCGIHYVLPFSQFLDGRAIFVEVAKPRSELHQGSKQTPKHYWRIYSGILRDQPFEKGQTYLNLYVKEWTLHEISQWLDLQLVRYLSDTLYCSILHRIINQCWFKCALNLFCRLCSISCVGLGWLLCSTLWPTSLVGFGVLWHWLASKFYMEIVDAPERGR